MLTDVHIEVLREQERFVTDDETIELKKYLHNGLSKCRWNVDGSTIVYTRLVITVGFQFKCNFATTRFPSYLGSPTKIPQFFEKSPKYTIFNFARQ